MWHISVLPTNRKTLPGWLPIGVSPRELSCIAGTWPSLTTAPTVALTQNIYTTCSGSAPWLGGSGALFVPLSPWAGSCRDPPWRLRAPSTVHRGDARPSNSSVSGGSSTPWSRSCGRRGTSSSTKKQQWTWSLSGGGYKTASSWKCVKTRTRLEQSGGWTTGRNLSSSPPPTEGTQKPLGTNTRAGWTFFTFKKCVFPTVLFKSPWFDFPTVLFLFVYD